MVCLTHGVVPLRTPTSPAVREDRVETFTIIKFWLLAIKVNAVAPELVRNANALLVWWRQINSRTAEESMEFWLQATKVLTAGLAHDMARGHKILGSEAKWYEVHEISGDCVAFSQEIASENLARAKTAAMLDAIDGKAVG